jgi:hydrogenase-4 component B
VWNHALFKALLFFGAGAVLHAAGTREIDALGGLARRMPRTAFAFLFGAVAICGLPPLNGFVSELFVYMGCFQAMTSGLWGAGAFAAPALALIGALAAACFVKVYGAVFLGEPRSERGARAHDPGGRMLAPMAALAVGCLAIGLAPAAVAPVLEGATRTWAPEAAALAEPLQVLAPLRVLSATGVTLVLLVGAAAALLARRGHAAPLASGPTWDCGFAAPSARMQYTASSFAQTLVGFFSWALRPSVHAGAPAGLFPAATRFETHVPDTVLERAILPLSRGGARALRWFRWVQHGNVHLYLVYVVATLIVLWLVGR